MKNGRIKKTTNPLFLADRMSFDPQLGQFNSFILL
jgi:hypothetical protein